MKNDKVDEQLDIAEKNAHKHGLMAGTAVGLTAGFVSKLSRSHFAPAFLGGLLVPYLVISHYSFLWQRDRILLAEKVKRIQKNSS